MTEKFTVTFYKQWLSILLVPVLGLPLVAMAFKATGLLANGGGFLLYVGVLGGGFWGIFWLIKKWALVPCEVTVSEAALTIENLSTGEVLQILFADIQMCRLDSWQLLMRLKEGGRVQFRINGKFYNPGSFVEMSRALKWALQAARGRNIIYSD
ncbi:MAG: hypothetical protein ACRYG7_39055 [Janthinobacterium lividum]